MIAADSHSGLAMDLESGFCTTGDRGRRGVDSHTCSSGMSSECLAELRQSCSSSPKEEDDFNGKVGHVRALGEVNDEYIVRFKEYRHASELKRTLDERLEGSGRVWQWLERNNPASGFPTDFALLRIKRAKYDGVLEALRRLEFVKDVSPQMRFTRALTSEKSEDEYSSGTGDEDLTGKYETCVLEKEEMLESKPPGRLRTKLSSEIESEDLSTPFLANVSLNHGRKLLLQVAPFLFEFWRIFVRFSRDRDLLPTGYFLCF